MVEKVSELFRVIGDQQSISINLSSASLSMLERNQALMTLAERVGPRLCVEVTERSMVANFELAAKALQRLRALGVKVFLDDFGTGYSSLSYVHRLPVDALKIDQSFVARLGEDKPSESLIRMIVALAESLSLDVIAEGIETEQQRNLLNEMNVIYGQGYFFGKPETQS